MRNQRHKYPSVTEVLEAYINFDAVPKNVLAAARARGDAVHSICANYANYGLAMNVPDEYKGYLKSFKQFMATVDKVLAVEQRITNPVLGLTGKVDLIVVFKNERMPRVTDLKTPTTVYRTWKGQLAAYKMLAEFEYAMITDAPASIRLKADGSGFLMNYVDRWIEEQKMFQMALTLYRHYVT